MADRTKPDDHEHPALTDLEAENIIVRKKRKDREKPILTESAGEHKDRQQKE